MRTWRKVRNFASQKFRLTPVGDVNQPILNSPKNLRQVKCDYTLHADPQVLNSCWCHRLSFIRESHTSIYCRV